MFLPPSCTCTHLVLLLEPRGRPAAAVRAGGVQHGAARGRGLLGRRLGLGLGLGLRLGLVDAAQVHTETLLKHREGLARSSGQSLVLAHLARRGEVHLGDDCERLLRLGVGHGCQGRVVCDAGGAMRTAVAERKAAEAKAKAS